MEYGVYGNLNITCPKPYSIYFRGTVLLNGGLYFLIISSILFNAGSKRTWAATPGRGLAQGAMANAMELPTPLKAMITSLSR